MNNEPKDILVITVPSGSTLAHGEGQPIPRTKHFVTIPSPLERAHATTVKPTDHIELQVRR